MSAVPRRIRSVDGARHGADAAVEDDRRAVGEPRGFSNRCIAEELRLSEATIKRHLANVYQKVGVNSRTEAVRAAIMEQWIGPHEITSARDADGLRPRRALPYAYADRETPPACSTDDVAVATGPAGGPHGGLARAGEASRLDLGRHPRQPAAPARRRTAPGLRHPAGSEDVGPSPFPDTTSRSRASDTSASWGLSRR